MASRFAKINVIFLAKKPAEVNAYLFIAILSRTQSCARMLAQSRLSVVERLLRHVETPSTVNPLQVCSYVQHSVGSLSSIAIQWLSSEDLMVELLSPTHISDMVSELIKGIRSMATAKPAPGLTDGLQWRYFRSLFQGAGPHGPRSANVYICNSCSEVPQICVECSS